MEKLIDVVNKLQAVFSSTNIGDLHREIQLPQIVVIGAQSAGKSSVLEGIVGKDFLPRGTGIVTRRPLILHLNFCAIDDPFRSNFLEVEPETDFAIFEHVGQDTVFVDFDEVCNEIAEDTDRIAGDNKGICSKPIILSIYSHKLVKLSLVDLPGITKVPIGDQPLDIETQIRNMLMEYIVNPNSIILAVTAANQDFATSEAIKLAQEVDPDGERTLAVLTKLDLMDKGTDAMKELTGKVIPIKRGIVGVINRSQADIVAKKEIEDCWEYERNFLHQNYRSIAHRNGIKYLAGILHKMLMEHIYSCLPDLRTRIDENIKKWGTEKQILGETIKDPKAKLVDLVKRFVDAYNGMIMGMDAMEVDDDDTEMSDNDELIGGAKISNIFHGTYHEDINEIDLTDGLKTEDIYKAKLRAEGLHPSIIVPEKCFESLTRKQIKRLEEPSLACVENVHDEMKKAIGYCNYEILREFKRFPAFATEIYNFIIRMLDERADEAKKFIKNSIGSHEKFINTKHPDFSSERALLMMLMKIDPNISTMAAEHARQYGNSFGTQFLNDIKESDEEIKEKYGGEIAKKMSKREWENCVLIGRLVKAYFKIVRKAVQDQTMKQIYSEMIHYVKKNLQSGLLIQMLDSNLNELLQEDEDITQQRIEAENRLDVLNKAKLLLGNMNINAYMPFDL